MSATLLARRPRECDATKKKEPPPRTFTSDIRGLLVSLGSSENTRKVDIRTIKRSEGLWPSRGVKTKEVVN